MIVAILAVAGLTYALGWIGCRLWSGRFQRGSIYSVAFIVAFVGWIFARPHIGFKEPGHWFECGEYSTNVTVNIFPDGSASKNYRVTGRIWATHYDTDYEDSGSGSTRVYYLESVRFPNGGVLRFDDAVISLYGVEAATDVTGKHWHIEIADTSPPERKKRVASTAPLKTQENPKSDAHVSEALRQQTEYAKARAIEAAETEFDAAVKRSAQSVYAVAPEAANKSSPLRKEFDAYIDAYFDNPQNDQSVFNDSNWPVNMWNKFVAIRSASVAIAKTPPPATLPPERKPIVYKIPPDAKTTPVPAGYSRSARGLPDGWTLITETPDR
ncbi:MAG: hypothetical protein H7Y06_12725 [Opitutaceae bacterium]|nr:hypothetical protein [Opitutaceae bacterium]